MQFYVHRRNKTKLNYNQKEKRDVQVIAESKNNNEKCLLVVDLQVKETHLGTAFSNHTSKLSSRVPSKSQIRGLLGAALGIPFEDTQSLDFGYAYYWLTSPHSQMVAMNREVFKSAPNTRREVFSNREHFHTIDYIEHLYNPSGNRLIGRLYIEIDEVNALYYQESLKNPVFPLYLGKVENMVSIKKVTIERDLHKSYEEAEFSDFFVGSSTSFLITERLVDKMRSYRTPLSLSSVYSLPQKIRGKAASGHYELVDRNLCLW